MLLRHCCRFGNNVEATFDFVTVISKNVKQVFVKFRPFNKVETY